MHSTFILPRSLYEEDFYDTRNSILLWISSFGNYLLIVSITEHYFDSQCSCYTYFLVVVVRLQWTLIFPGSVLRLRKLVGIIKNSLSLFTKSLYSKVRFTEWWKFLSWVRGWKGSFFCYGPCSLSDPLYYGTDSNKETIPTYDH